MPYRTDSAAPGSYIARVRTIRAIRYLTPLREGGSVPAAVVWFDAFITNVDRTPRNPNLLRWHKQLFLIDHGAALYFHHDWPTQTTKVKSPFAMVRNHVLLPLAGDLRATDAQLAPRITEPALREILAQVPDDWLAGEATPELKR